MRKFRNSLTVLALAGLVAASPAIANADVVDDYLAAIPAGEISCQQANAYWTDASDYQNKRSQALVGATFHPRGGEIRDAINRIDNAANRCGLLGNGGRTAAAPAQRGGQQTPTPVSPAAPNTVTVAGQTVEVPAALSPVITTFRGALSS